MISAEAWYTKKKAKILAGRARDFCRTWPNQEEVTVTGKHFIQEDSPNEIGQSIAKFIRKTNQ